MAKIDEAVLAALAVRPCRSSEIAAASMIPVKSVRTRIAALQTFGRVCQHGTRHGEAVWMLKAS